MLKVHLPYIILVSGVLMFADCVSPEPSDSGPQICSASLSSHNKCNLPISSLYKINLGETSHNVHHLTRDESPDTSSTTSGSEPKTQLLISGFQGGERKGSGPYIELTCSDCKVNH